MRSVPPRCCPTRSRSACTLATPRWSKAAARSSPSLARATTSSPASVSLPNTAFRWFPGVRGPGSSAVHADRRCARPRDDEDDPDPRDPAGGPSRVGGARRAEPRPRERLPPARVHVRARSVLAADVVDRRERQHQRRRPALSRLRRDVEPRAGARRRPRGRERRASGFRGSRDARLRPPSRHGRERRDARDRGGGVRSAHAAARCGAGRCCSTSRPSRTARPPSAGSSRAASSPPPSR